MARCKACKQMILLGGVQEDGNTYCNAACCDQGRTLAVAAKVPRDVLEYNVRLVHEGPCPVCSQKSSPIDFNTSYTVMSFVLVSFRSAKPKLCCRSCARSSQLVGFVTTFFLGWWGIPHGIIFTPIYLFNNLTGMLGSKSLPSPELIDLVRQDLAAKARQQLASNN